MDKFTKKKIKEFLGTKMLEKTDFRASGCINEGEGYRTDKGVVFIKKNGSKYAKVMFNSEIAGLTALEKTNTIKVPHPIGVVEGSNNIYYCILEFVEIRSLDKFTSQLGEKVAELHLHNEQVAKKRKDGEYVSRFGFPEVTCVGLLPVDNTWSEDWSIFYSNRLEEQIKRLQTTQRDDKEAMQLWQQLKPLIPKFFENIEVKPSLLHGDLWGGNIGETDTEPIIFDPGCVYGHHEFDLAMTSMFGRFGSEFYDSYHSRIPKAPGFKEREQLYRLFHFLNHWNHFGAGYKSSSIMTMEKLIKTNFPLK